LKTIRISKKIGVVIAFSPQAKYFIIGFISGEFILFDSSSEAFNILFILNDSNKEAFILNTALSYNHFGINKYSFCFSPDNLTLACG